MPLTVNDQVLSFVNFFQTPRGRAIVETGLRRAGRYRAMISRVLREQGLPSDLIYMAQAESAFQPRALSRAGARGMWQFVSYRGQEYGLRHSWWVDDRQDPEKATRAAAASARPLRTCSATGTWPWRLTMRARAPCSEPSSAPVMPTSGSCTSATRCRKETRNYVPIILALTLIAKDPARYGIDVEPGGTAAHRWRATGPGHRFAAGGGNHRRGRGNAAFAESALLRLATPGDPSFALHLPEGAAQKFSAEIADIPPDKWVSWRRHRVESGETLTSIAKKYHVTAAAVADANSLERNAALEAGEKLIIPAIQPPSETKRQLVSYRVRRGDTFLGIADRYNVSADDLRKWNHLKANRVNRGMVLRVYTLGGTPESSPARAKSKPKKKTTPAVTGSTSSGAGATNHN